VCVCVCVRVCKSVGFDVRLDRKVETRDGNVCVCVSKCVFTLCVFTCVFTPCVFRLCVFTCA